MNSPDPNAILIDPHAGFSAAFDLASSLHNMRHKPVMIDASEVEHIGAPCLEVLLSAARSWGKDAVEFRIINSTVAFNEGIARLGVLPSELGDIIDAEDD